ncbi:unnamed protein product [Cuscuta epithymum]|uniref:Uncharacterized protein n=1 Tax=Cuscuta epithymum TaxID=186058 RepID=A0AAV0FAF3_9ASTE|nr:unnamed protein product [Cuscuta epithymum]
MIVLEDAFRSRWSKFFNRAKLFRQGWKQAQKPYALLHKNCNSQKAFTQVGSTIWKPSSLGIFKLNAGVSTGGVRQNFGWVFRDSASAFVAQVAKPWEGFVHSRKVSYYAFKRLCLDFYAWVYYIKGEI